MRCEVIASNSSNTASRKSVKILPHQLFVNLVITVHRFHVIQGL